MKWGTIATDSSLAWSGVRKRPNTDRAAAFDAHVNRVEPSGKNPKIEASPSGVVISWDDGKGHRVTRKLPAGVEAIWEDGAFRICVGDRNGPVARPAGGW